MREYCADGYTKNMGRIIRNNPLGYEAYIVQRLRLDRGFARSFSDAIRYVAIRKVLKKSPFTGEGNRFVSLLAYPFGLLLYYKRYRV